MDDYSREPLIKGEQAVLGEEAGALRGCPPHGGWRKTPLGGCRQGGVPPASISN
jgi:hypothetical protein